MKKLVIGLIIILGILANYAVFCSEDKTAFKDDIIFTLQIEGAAAQDYQVFYSIEDGFSESASIMIHYEPSEGKKLLEFAIPSDSQKLRLDFGITAGEHMIEAPIFMYKGSELYASAEGLLASCEAQSMIESCTQNGEEIVLITNGEDSNMVFDLSSLTLEERVSLFDRSLQTRRNLFKMAFLDVVLLGLIVGLIKFGAQLRNYCREVWQNKKVIYDFSKNDFKVKYAGSYLGIFWAFVQPLVTIGVYWFVFQVGFRSGSVVEGYPFIVWLISGLVPWFFYVEAISSGTNCLLDYSYLVKKIVFPINVLPLIRVLSTYYLHIFFMVFQTVVFLVYGCAPDLYWLQLIYCEICLIVMLVGSIYATSALVVFFKDLSQIITIVIQIGVWLTPILWDYRSVLGNSKLLFVLKLNPMFYVVEQYRNALIDKAWFWENYYLTIYFWGFNIAMFGIGTFLFRKLKVHFADVI